MCVVGFFGSDVKLEKVGIYGFYEFVDLRIFNLFGKKIIKYVVMLKN